MPKSHPLYPTTHTSPPPARSPARTPELAGTRFSSTNQPCWGAPLGAYLIPLRTASSIRPLPMTINGSSASPTHSPALVPICLCSPAPRILAVTSSEPYDVNCATVG
jgi:hypothetical protein